MATEKTTEKSIAKPHWKRNISMFLGGQAASLFGSSLVQYAIMWHLTITYQSGWIITLAAIFGFLPQALISLFAGVWADRLNRKFIVMISDGIIAFATLGLAILSMMGMDALWIVFVVLTIRSLGAGVQTPAVSALIPQIVPKKELLRINGINGSIQSMTFVLAPLLAMAIYSAAGRSMTPIFFIDVVSAAIGISILAFIPIKRLKLTAQEKAKGYFDEIKAGLKYMHNHKFIRNIFVFFTIFSLLIVPMVYLMPLLITREFGEAVWHVFTLQIGGFSWTLNMTLEWRLLAFELAFSFGMGIGGGVIATVAKAPIMKKRVLLLAVSTIGFGILAMIIGLFTHYWFIAAITFVVGNLVALNGAASNTIFQEKVDAKMQGRMFSLIGIVWAVAMPIGMMIVGPLADVVSIQSILIVSGLLTLALGAGVLASKLRKQEAVTPDANE